MHRMQSTTNPLDLSHISPLLMRYSASWESEHKDHAQCYRLLYRHTHKQVTQYFLFAHCPAMFVFILTQNIILNHLLGYSVTSKTHTGRTISIQRTGLCRRNDWAVSCHDALKTVALFSHTHTHTHQFVCYAMFALCSFGLYESKKKTNDL